MKQSDEVSSGDIIPQPSEQSTNSTITNMKRTRASSDPGKASKQAELSPSPSTITKRARAQSDYGNISKQIEHPEESGTINASEHIQQLPKKKPALDNITKTCTNDDIAPPNKKRAVTEEDSKDQGRSAKKARLPAKSTAPTKPLPAKKPITFQDMMQEHIKKYGPAGTVTVKKESRRIVKPSKGNNVAETQSAPTTFKQAPRPRTRKLKETPTKPKPLPKPESNPKPKPKPQSQSSSKSLPKKKKVEVNKMPVFDNSDSDEEEDIDWDRLDNGPRRQDE